MKKSTKGILIISLFVFSAFAASFAALAVLSQTKIFPEPMRLEQNFDKKFEYAYSDFEIDTPDIPQSAHDGTYWEVNDTAWWMILDNYMGYYDFAQYTLRGIGDNNLAELWVQNDLSYDPGAGRDPDVITDEQVTYMLGEFENNIHPIESNYFGPADYHDGEFGTLDTDVGLPDGYWSGSDRHVILISNIRDVLYYEPVNVYIAGFYSSNYEFWFDRNIMTIDTLAWDYYLEDPYYRYEGTFAHEYQHLLHADHLAGDETFINEGCSMFSELLTGYPPAFADIDIFFEQPDNSLTEWGDMGHDFNILADYGQVLLFMAYLNDQFGSDFLHNYFANGNPGIWGLEALLPDGKTFEDVVRDWRLANFIHSDYPGNGKYNYESIDLNWAIGLPEDDPMHIDPIEPYQLKNIYYPQWFYGSEFGETDPFGPTGVIELGPYGTDYIQLDHMKKLNWLFFNGEDGYPAVNQWTQSGYVPYLSLVFGEDYYLPGEGWWWSGMADLMDNALVAEVYVDGADPTLTFDTYFDIEPQWDYGFVQVSTDGGDTWTSLANEYTFIPPVDGAHYKVKAYQPGLTDWSYWWGGLDPIPMVFDLTAYAEQDIMIGFRMVNDWNTLYDGWFINNVEVSGAPASLYNQPVELDWLVTAIAMDKNGNPNFVWDFYIDDETEYGATLAYLTSNHDSVVIAITPTMTEGKADYRISTKKFKCRWFFHGD